MIIDEVGNAGIEVLIRIEEKLSKLIDALNTLQSIILKNDAIDQ